MPARARIESRLPPAALDAARVLRDLISPARRRDRRARRDRGPDPLAVRVSPAGTVLAGPFAGLRLPLDAGWGGLAARLAGTYEREIAGVVAEIVAAAPRSILDIGCAEGYYAVGLARRLPAARVLAFDLDPQARRACRACVRINGVRNVRVRGRVTPRSLRRHLSPGAVVILDCEGYEQALLDPDAAPELRACTIPVELHEFAAPGVTATIRERFRGHDVELITARPRTREDAAHLTLLAPGDALAAVQEGRIAAAGPMQWAVIRPPGTLPAG